MIEVQFHMRWISQTKHEHLYRCLAPAMEVPSWATLYQVAPFQI
jgi:hypothetical protein